MKPFVKSTTLLCLATALTPVGLVATIAPVLAQETISAERCEANKASGKVTFLTSFAYAASAGILDVVAAKELGYFEALCIDLAIEPGGNNTQLVSANTAQIAGIGGPSDTMVAIDNGAQIVGIATYGNVGAIELLTMKGSAIEKLEDFVGKTVGYKGAVAPQFSAMFLDNGVDATAINWVSVGYDPTILPNGQVEGLGAYKSNEPKALGRQGFEVVEWDPAAYGIKSNFNTQIANKDFAAANPTVVEDFLRASFKAFEWINESDANLDTALGYAAALSDAGYNLESSKVRWQTEIELIKASQPAGTPIGWQSVEQWQPEADMLLRFELVKAAADPATAQSNAFVAAISSGTDLVWPAP